MYKGRYFNSSVIWPKSESQNGGNKTTKHAKFSEKRTFFTSLFLVFTISTLCKGSITWIVTKKQRENTAVGDARVFRAVVNDFF